MLKPVKRLKLREEARSGSNAITEQAEEAEGVARAKASVYGDSAGIAENPN